MTENEIAKIIVDVAFKIHTMFGPGLLESVYAALLAYELRKRGLDVHVEQPIPVIYESIRRKYHSHRQWTRRQVVNRTPLS